MKELTNVDMKVALILIATGQYRNYLVPLIESAKKYFVPHEILLFTDECNFDVSKQVKYERLGFPKDTLFRYHTILSQKEWLLQFDQIFYLDTDTLIMSNVGKEIFSNGITAMRHPWVTSRFEENIKSTAYVDKTKASIYYQACIVGGKTNEFLNMCDVLNTNINKDYDNGIIAICHDESHLNRYLFDNPPTKVLPSIFCSPINTTDTKIIHFNAHDLYGSTCNGYKYCAMENESFNFIEPCDIAYGANDKFVYLDNQIGTIVFNNSTFGKDPVPNKVKMGFFKVHSNLKDDNIAINTIDQGYAVEQESHLGGYFVNGDPGSWSPEIWDKIITDYKIKSVLDIGCGLGFSTKYFYSKKLQVLGVEGGSNAIKNSVCRNIIVQNDYTKSSAPLGDQFFDLIWSCEFVEHVEEKFIDNFLKDFCRGKIISMTYAEIAQPGYHHVNCQHQEYWIHKIQQLGYTFNKNYSQELRKIAFHNHVPHLTRILLFEKNKT